MIDFEVMNAAIKIVWIKKYAKTPPPGKRLPNIASGKMAVFLSY